MKCFLLNTKRKTQSIKPVEFNNIIPKARVCAQFSPPPEGLGEAVNKSPR
jgi:hypothetical protein